MVGVSLGSPCRMRLRPYPHVRHGKSRSLVLVLEPLSAYVLRNDARWRWQHAISPTKALRYSITCDATDTVMFDADSRRYPSRREP